MREPHLLGARSHQVVDEQAPRVVRRDQLPRETPSQSARDIGARVDAACDKGSVFTSTP